MMNCNPSTSGTGQLVKTLPRTIEEATRRYVHHYSKCFVGPAHELTRLRNLARAFILRLRKVAPKFYDEKLPHFVNQACSTLLTYDTSTAKGIKEFHECHSAFLCILKAFKQSQPAGEISFSGERLRLVERNNLKSKYLQLRAEIEKLEAEEIDYDDLGEDDDENAYDEVFRKLDILKAELKRVSIEIAYIDGYEVEEPAGFELIVPARSSLNSLTKEQLEHLEKQMFDLVKENKNKRTAMYVDKSIIDSMIEKLNIDMTKFRKEQIRDITKDALDAYKAYFRGIESRNRERFYAELLTRPSLIPKEGILIRDPDDIPEDIKLKLDSNIHQCKREIDDLLDSYSKRPCAEDHTGDNLDASDEEEDDTHKIIETVRSRGIKYERVKEEPRDDCEETFSGDEVVVESSLAAVIVDNNEIKYVKTVKKDVDEREEKESEDDERNTSDPEENNHQDQVKMELNGTSDGISNSHEEDESGQDGDVDDDDDDDIEFLGTVEPSDKIATLDLDE